MGAGGPKTPRGSQALTFSVLVSSLAWTSSPALPPLLRGLELLVGMENKMENPLRGGKQSLCCFCVLARNFARVVRFVETDDFPVDFASWFRTKFLVFFFSRTVTLLLFDDWITKLPP